MPHKSMAELQSLVGQTRTTAEGLRVERGKIAEFANAIGDRNPVYHDPSVARERGFEDVPAPPTFTRTAMFERHRPEGYSGDHNFDLGFERGSQLHGSQTYEFERPLVAGDVLDGETTLVDISQRDGQNGQLTVAEFETAYTDPTDTTVVTARLTRIEVGGGLATEDATDRSQVENPHRSRPAAWPYDDQYPVAAADVERGMTGPAVTVDDLGVRDFVVYAGASGDFNRMHYDMDYARSKGSPTLFAQGMLTAAYAGRVVTTWFGPRTLEEFAIRFQKPVWLGDSIMATGEITEAASVDAGTAVDVSIEVQNQRDETVATGHARMTLPGT